MTARILALLLGFQSVMTASPPLEVKTSGPSVPASEGFRMGSSVAPDGSSIGINSRFLTKNGKPWMPVMGEFHYSRCPQAEWREELLRMKAGGVDIAATYVFWNHHEELEGVWQWSGDRDLRKFLQLCKETGMLASVRMGPWCHGEVRNGGIPDWVLEKSWKIRSDDKGYLQAVERLYEQIAKQIDGLQWKDGGPVAIVQFENEFRGPPEHLLTLKRIAEEKGIDVPISTKTGWPAMNRPMPFGEMLPLFGAYAEGFWDRSLRSMPGKYWAAFRFANVRTDAAIATEQLGERAAEDEADAHRYPYLTCEIGGGMMSSYHRRILMHPADVEAVALVKVGSGGNLPGYYMYHGGVNPEGVTTLMEEQATKITNYNDMPVKNYDFQAPLGSFGQTRPHYHWLRRMHLMIRDFGEVLAPMPSFLPDKIPGGAADLSTLRWAVRSDGNSGFLFVNNHQRGAEMPGHREVSFSIQQNDQNLVWPEKPVEILPGARFIWPFGIDLGYGVRLEWATAQPICRIDEDNRRTYFFAETPGVVPVIKIAGRPSKPVKPARTAAMEIQGADGAVQLVVLSDPDSLALWKGRTDGRDRVILSKADVTFHNTGISLRSRNPEELSALVFPPLDGSPTDGIFGLVPNGETAGGAPTVGIRQIRKAGPPREIAMGRNKVAAAPGEYDFRKAAAWEVRLPDDYDAESRDDLLRIRYHGDVARLRIGGKLVLDDFFNGRPLEIGLRRFAKSLGEERRLTVEILSLPPGAPVFLPESHSGGMTAELDGVTLVPRFHAQGAAGAAAD
ncbi:MAG: beta-galactosidase [Verrucomicrobiae bacterium]|nr:beta-galactosidase [Verrucomicrobiae bacterium]MCP5543953.1 beta-galactosidase [Akkermansiaceae bacterium]